MKKLELGSSKIYIPDIIIGLTDEANKVSRVFHKIKPDLVAIQTSEEELKGLKKVVEGEDFEYYLSNYEEIYAKKLAEFGEVKVPPPCYETAMNLCIEYETPIVAIDMDDMLYADAFCENISGWDMYRHSFRVNRLKRKEFTAETAKEFVIEWDKEINKLKGFRNLEEKRENYMAREILRLAKENECILCVIDIQRVDGVLNRVKEEVKSIKKK
jgi:pheromone shutdown protein TraB